MATIFTRYGDGSPLEMSASDFMAEDKKLHAAAGLATYAGCIFIGAILDKQDVTDIINSKTCVLPVIAVAVGKEVYDSHADGHVAEFSDITATIVAPLLISYSITF